ncbi:NAD(P)H-dependent oxidoreductase [bacterium]|nr:NAD(P)H-dependent oxidoreductase [bacterium]
MNPKLQILAIIGSLRKESWNRALYQNMMDRIPASLHCEEAPIASIPLYDGDLEEAAFPESVTQLKEKIRKADGILFVTPEYNYSIPGVLKNVLDWTSRPPTEIPYINKPGAIVGASTSYFGTVRSQLHLRQVLHALGMIIMNTPEIMIPKSETFFVDRKITDERMIKKIDKFWIQFEKWILKNIQSIE